MTIKSFLEVLQAKPFRPFEINLADGRRVQVTHPDFIARSKTDRSVILFREGDRFETIDVLHIASLDIAGTTSRARRKSN